MRAARRRRCAGSSPRGRARGSARRPRCSDRDLALVDVEAQHVVADLGEAGAGDEADVAGPDHRDLHARHSFDRCVDRVERGERIGRGRDRHGRSRGSRRLPRAPPRGVITRAWSCASTPAGRMPGVTSLKPAPSARLSAAASAPSRRRRRGRCACARRASRSTCSSGVRVRRRSRRGRRRTGSSGRVTRDQQRPRHAGVGARCARPRRARPRASRRRRTRAR